MDLIDKQEVRLIESDADAYPQEWNDDYEKGFCDAIHKVLELPTADAQPEKHGHWSECFRDSRCISVICSVCKNPTVISNGCRDADEVTMNYVIERLPHCPKCCSDMRGDADEPH